MIMQRILVLGSGQLGLMLAEAASRLGVQLDRLNPEEWTLLRGTSPVPEALPRDWDGLHYDRVTVEREHFPDRAVLERFAGHPGFGALDAVSRLADRRSQKSLLDALDVATAEWCVVHGPEDLDRLQRQVGLSLIVKAATGGYDGHGQWRVQESATKLPPTATPGHVIAERAVPFDRELSLVGARNAAGECVFFPLVENVHRHGMLVCTVAPARVDAAQQEQAETMLRCIMDELDYVGVMAMECFEESGRLLVNELAPRVHNSGHWSQEGANIDQFELHLRAVAGLPLMRPAATRRTVMLNLVGTEFDPVWLQHGHARLHWYGKEVRPGRKLGHLNVCSARGEELTLDLQGLLKEWDPLHRQDIRSALAVLERDDRTKRQTAPSAGSATERAANA
jgi:5-(carboxyamino)imidazole ribonucleotide synthase